MIAGDGPQDPRSDEFAFIDWLRGIAALLVVYFHFDLHAIHHYPATPIVPGSFTDLFVLGRFDLGKYAVAVFFLVSGFLIPSTLADGKASLARFGAHRFFRLYPAYWFSLLVFAVVQLAIGNAQNLNWTGIAINLTMLQQVFGVPDVIGVYWTLLIELVFYGVCALLFLLGRLQQRGTVVLLALGCGLVFAQIRHATGIAMPVALFIALALMFAGDGLRAMADGRASRASVVRLVAITAIALVPICLLSYGTNAPRYILTYWVAGATFVAAFAMRARIASAVRANRIGKFLADCSYSVYLLHGSIGMAVTGPVLARTGSTTLAAIAMFGTTLASAYVAYRWIEAPGIRLGRRITGC